MTNNTRSSIDETMSFTSKLKLLPVATVREKLNFPLKFEKQSFCLDFRSAGGSATSDCEPTSAIAKGQPQPLEPASSKLNLLSRKSSAVLKKSRNLT